MSPIQQSKVSPPALVKTIPLEDSSRSPHDRHRNPGFRAWALDAVAINYPKKSNFFSFEET